jgi:outer membrane protein TolC
MKRLFLLFSVITYSALSFGQETYTLKQCIDYALKNHRSIKMATNDVSTAYARKQEGQSAYMPQINGQAKWDDNLILQSSVIPSLSLGSISTPEQVVKFGNQYNLLAGVQLDQMLFNWTYIQGIKAIQPGYDIAKMKKSKTEEDVIYNTIVAYYNVLLILENEKLLTQNQDRLAKTIPIVRLQLDKGMVRKVDLDKIQVNYNNIIGQLSILNANKTTTINNLKYNIGYNLSSDLFIDTTFSHEIISANNYTDTANIKNRIEMQLMRKNIYLQGILLERTKGNYYPQFAFYAKYGGQAFGDKFSKSFTNWYQFASIGFQLTIPIFDGLRNASSIKMDKLNIANLKEEMALKEEGLKLQMMNVNTEMKNAEQNLVLSKENIELAKNVYDVSTVQYQKGTISYTDWMTSEYSYKEAEQNYLTSLVKYLQSKIEADKSNNNLNTYRN